MNHKIFVGKMSAESDDEDRLSATSETSESTYDEEDDDMESAVVVEEEFHNEDYHEAEQHQQEQDVLVFNFLDLSPPQKTRRKRGTRYQYGELICYPKPIPGFYVTIMDTITDQNKQQKTASLSHLNPNAKDRYAQWADRCREFEKYEKK